MDLWETLTSTQTHMTLQQATYGTNWFKSWRLHLPQHTANLKQLVDLMKKITSAVWQHCSVTLVKTGQSGNSPGREPTIKGSQLNSNDSKEGGNSLIEDKGCPKCQHESLVNLGPIAFTIRWHLSFLPALTSYDFTLRSSDKGTLLCTGSHDTRGKEQKVKSGYPKGRVGRRGRERRVRKGTFGTKLLTLPKANVHHTSAHMQNLHYFSPV